MDFTTFQRKGDHFVILMHTCLFSAMKELHKYFDQTETPKKSLVCSAECSVATLSEVFTAQIHRFKNN